MSEWKEIIFGELGYTYPGLSGKTKKDFGSGKPFIPFMNVMANGKIDPEFLGYVEVLENEHQSEIKTGDLFFTTSSETPEEVGMTSVLLNDIGECYLNSFCFGFRLYNYDDLIPEYAPYLFRGNEVRKQIINLGQGYTRFNLPKTELVKKLTLNLPTIPEQQNISVILTAIDNIIEKTQAAITKYKLIKQGMLHDLFTRGIDIQTGKLRPRYQDAPELYKESKLGWIPREWEVEEIGSCIDPIMSNVDKHIRADELRTLLCNYMDVYTNRYLTQNISYSIGSVNSSEYFRFSLQPQDVIITKDSETPDDIAVPSILIEKVEDLICGYHLCILRSKDLNKLNGEFIMLQLQHLKINRQFANRANGTTRYGLTIDAIEESCLLVPNDLNEQLAIVKRLRTTEMKLETEQSYLEKMQQIKKGLMEDLLSGKKRVKILND